ncbi:MAG: carboxylating nicotinate-nucleotide diphosphorylase [Deltaproteobacteria bacterium]|nr:carboxylating nicotinate-nucleotide diphosphorylase [Deltaproteobacteria bacterium]MBI3293138.1 carboxylating nicotinate-nucleotide diphosphorylase [Deltaproteobacteria bacterium]
MNSTDPSVKNLLDQEFRVDSATHDETTLAIIPAGARARGTVIAKQDGVFSGREIAEAVAAAFEGRIHLKSAAADGAVFHSGDQIVMFEGDLRALLGSERTLLNFLMHTCGVATLTRRFVNAVAPHTTKILATRKTTPGLRSLDLAAVVHGGGAIHRRSLSDGVLIKENHLWAIDPATAIRKAREGCSPLHGVEIEVQNLALLDSVLEAKPDIIMLDNLGPEQVRTAIHRIAGHARVEISGGINLETIKDYAGLGADYISVGRITHSAPACDLSLDLCHE